MPRKKKEGQPIPPTVQPDGAGYTVINSDTPLDIDITQKHVEAAVCRDPAKCVIAQALKERLAHCIEGFAVGPRTTKIIHEGKKVVRYNTPASLSNSLKTFDETGTWKLPPGRYTLRPYRKNAGNRFKYIKNKVGKGGVVATFKGPPATKTRHAETVCQIIARKDKEAKEKASSKKAV